MTWTKEELKKLNKNLPANGIQILSAEFGLKKGSVKNILYGLVNNEAVILRAAELALAYREELEVAKTAIKNL